ncbi:MAG: hypothetical protein DWQ05_06945 [Calditrichaeota bacterium]|nr:MAG: hypothetical protein DWQ05_06945 [Calditrichota bacterium]
MITSDGDGGNAPFIELFKAVIIQIFKGFFLIIDMKICQTNFGYQDGSKLQQTFCWLNCQLAIRFNKSNFVTI